jgi:hypothetical protein
VTVERPGAQLVVRIPRGGQIRVTSRDGTGESVPARIRIVGIDGTETPALGPDWRAAGALDTVVEVGGDVEVPLRPGRYRVLVTRGPEWTVVEETVEVTETFRPQISALLEQVVDPGEWVGCDFHLHAEPSYDSQVTLQDRIASLRAEGVRFAVPTDHNVVTDYGPTLMTLEVRDIGTVPGVEVTTWDPSFGHFNAFPVPVDPALPQNGAPEYQRLTPAALFESLRRFGPDTIVQINHPRLEPAIGYFDLLGLDPTTGTAADGFSWDFDVIEVWNGFDLARPEKLERVFTDWLALLAAGRRFVATGNSDSHFVRFQWAGYPRTYVRVPGGDFRDARAVLRALRDGRAFVTNGPFLEATVDGKGPGETATVPIGGEARVRIVVRAPPWIPVDTVDVFAGGQLIATRPVAGPRPPPPRPRPRPEPPLPVVRFDEEVPVSIAASTFIVVRATSLEPIREVFVRRVLPHAFTNPIWIEAGPPPVDAGPPDAGSPGP